ncbi:melatonin receptor type 1B-B-like [Branchiostoma floridae x Branchiostoma japonicum]
MRHHRRHWAAVLLLYYIQAVILGRALSVGAQTEHEVYSLCNTTRTNKTTVNDERMFNGTGFFIDAGFAKDVAFFKDSCLSNGTFSSNDTKTANVTLPPDIDEEAPWEDLLFIGLLAISALVGTVGNAAVILAFCIYKKVRTTANTFILNISFWDLVTSAVIIPLMISSMVTGLPNCGQACCAFIGFLSLFSITQSLMSSALISFNRYVHVVLSVATYRRLFGPVKTFLWVVGAWAIGTLIMFPAMSGIYGTLGWDAYLQICQLSYDDPQSPLFFKYVFLSLYCAAVSAISAFYARIYLHVRKSTMAIGQHLGHSPQQVSLQAVKRTKHMFCIFFTFLTLTGPVVVVNYADYYASLIPKAIFVISAAMFYLNNAVNPIIYTWTLKEFRQAFKSMVRCRRQLVPSNPPNVQPTCTAQRTSQLPGVVSRLTVSNRVGPAEPTIPAVDT